LNPNLQLGRACFKFADLAYEEAHVEDRETSTQIVFGGIASDPEAIFVGVRGTKEPRDFLNDAKFTFKAKWPGSELVRIHRGVAAAVDSVFARVSLRLSEAKRIFLCGHSLGGMKAQPLALRLRLEGFPIAGVHVFGTPRVGNGYFRKIYNAFLGDITFRWEAQGDPFPYTPPWLFNYRHAGRAAYLKNDGRVIFEPTLFDHVPAFIQTYQRRIEVIDQYFYNIFDPHNRTNYARLLKEARA
jgi:pimeloyl-ACP methyl ester carboxylesterase